MSRMTLYSLVLLVVVFFLSICRLQAFSPLTSRSRTVISTLKMADVEITFPNNKKAKVASGSSLKDAAKKAGFTPNYGCEEGKCGSCELKFAGKKIRPCTAKVPASTTPIKLENP